MYKPIGDIGRYGTFLERKNTRTKIALYRTHLAISSILEVAPTHIAPNLAMVKLW
jgi:hypothetical protein